MPDPKDFEEFTNTQHLITLHNNAHITHTDEDDIKVKV
jgi:hypothetical protein